MFRNSSDDRRVAIADDLSWLHQQRNRADYTEVIKDDLSAITRDAVKRAENVLRALDDLLSSPA